MNSTALQPAALAHFQLMEPARQAAAVRRLVDQHWSMDTLSRITGLSVASLIDLLREHPERL